MRSTKYDRSVWGLIAFVDALLLGFASLGCATPQQQLESFRVEVGHTHANQEIGKRDGDSDEWYVGGSWAPFRTQPSTTIIVFATHAAAEAGLPPGEVSVPCGTGGHR